MTPPPAPVPATSPASFMREPDLAELLGGPIPASVTAIPLRPSRVPPPRRASLPMAIDAPDLAYLAGPAEPAVPFPPPPPPSPRQPPAPAPLGLKPAPAIRPLTVPAWSNQGPMSRRPSVSPAPRAMSAMASSMSPPLTHVDGTGFVPTTPTVVVSREQLDHIRQLSANLRRRAQLERVRNLVGVLILLALCWYIWDWYQMQ
jgi:hypothetical protein